MDKAKLKSLLICPATSIKHAMQKLNETAKKILFVVDEHNRLLGTINDGDIRRALINGSKFDYHVGNVMHKSFVSVDRDVADIEGYSKKLMLEKKIEQIPVLDKTGIINDVILWTDIMGEEKLSLQRHYHRSEHWVVVKGTAKVTIGGKEILVHENESAYVPKSTLHRLENLGKVPLEIIEVQNGEYVGEDDIVRVEDNYGR